MDSKRLNEQKKSERLDLANGDEGAADAKELRGGRQPKPGDPLTDFWDWAKKTFF